jgi:hypothetical protein
MRDTSRRAIVREAMRERDRILHRRSAADLARQSTVSLVAFERPKIAPRTSLAGYEGFARQSCGKLREICLETLQIP